MNDITHVFVVLQPHDVFDSVYCSWKDMVTDFYLGEDDYHGWRVVDICMYGGTVIGQDEMPLEDAIILHRELRPN